MPLAGARNASRRERCDRGARRRKRRHDDDHLGELTLLASCRERTFPLRNTVPAPEHRCGASDDHPPKTAGDLFTAARVSISAKAREPRCISSSRLGSWRRRRRRRDHQRGGAGNQLAELSGSMRPKPAAHGRASRCSAACSAAIRMRIHGEQDEKAVRRP